MTRLGHGGLKLARDWVAPGDIVGSALNRLRAVLAPYRVQAIVANDLPLLYVHAALIEQALINVLENAARSRRTTAGCASRSARMPPSCVSR